VKPLSTTELEAAWAEIEATVDATAEIDPWCSGPDWVLSVHAGFAPGVQPLALRCDTPSGPGYALLARYPTADGDVVVAGLEPLWGFASPLLGTDIAAVAARLAAHLTQWDDWRILVLAGMPDRVEPGSFTSMVAGELSVLGPVRATTGIVRQVADLSGGHDPWWTRRSGRFRQRLRQATRRAEDAGLCLVDVADDPELFERLLAIEHASWKGQEESGITSPDMSTTYRTMIGRLQRRGRVRAFVARLDGRDVGYIVGGVRHGRYRGLQISYRAEVRHLSVGHLLQWHQIRELCATGEAGVYDLGMDLDYKRRWADRAEGTLTLVVDPRHRS
jgi:CelD/BcsL family acetyltransferase involved in cellulose biosynthesis